MILTLNFVIYLADSLAKNAAQQAFCINDKFFTYADMLKRINSIRTELSKVDDHYIGLVVNNDLDTYASVIATWMEGKCYIPLHPMQPLARCRDIISQVGIRTVLDSSLDSRYKDENVIRICNLPDNESFMPVVHPNADKPAYILFTSGTTGRPKGVPISYGNIDAFVNGFKELGIQIKEEDRCLQMFDLTFDLSVGCLLMALLNGACLYTVKQGVIKWLETVRLIDDYQLSVVLMAPSVLHYMLPYLDEIDVSHIRYSFFSAEASNVEDIKCWQKVSQAEMWNFYGPTESTIFCTTYKFPQSEIKNVNGIVCIGRPMNRVKAMVVDDNYKLLPEKSKGELCVAGDQLFKDYWDSSVIKSAFINYNGVRWYLTGDICSIDEAGDIYYYGRKDSQVKIQGYRIELSEIEYIARKFFENKVAVAAVLVTNKGGAKIGLAVECEDDSRDKELMDFLKHYLPSYMLPYRTIHLQTFPQNSNNKIDRNKIKELFK